MVTLIQDLTAYGPILFSMILIIAFSCAVWLIASLQHKKGSANRFTSHDTWILRRNVSRLKGLRHS